MKIPEAHICDAVGCMEDARFRITHEHLRVIHHPMIPHYDRAVVFEFCDEHATDFSIGGRGAWTTPPRLKFGTPEGA